MSVLVGNDNGNILVGAGAADTLYGKGGNDTLNGNGGNDALFGGLGNDRLLGGAGSDRLSGAEGNDTLVGGLGRDFLTGGAGRDTFAFDDKDTGDATAGPASDVILDLGKGDVIDLMAVDVLYFDGGVEPLRGGLSVNAGADGSAYITWKTFGTFHDIEVRGFDDTYDLYWNHIRWFADDNYGGFGTEVRLAGNATRHGTIENQYDQDWFRVDAQADHLYTFHMASQAGAKPAIEGFAFDLYDSDGFFVNESSGDRYVPAEFQLYAKAGESYYLQTYGSVGSYALSLTSVAYKDDFVDLFEDGRGKLSAGTTKTGSIGHDGDRDGFDFQVETGKTYVIDVEGTATKAGSLADPYAEVYDAGGFFVTDDDDGGTGDNAHIEFTAAENGTYSLGVSSAIWGETGSYAINLSVSDELA